MKTKKEFDFLKNRICKSMNLKFINNENSMSVHYVKPLKVSNYIFMDDFEFKPIFDIEDVISYELKIKKHKSYNGYTVEYYKSIGNFALNLCNNATYSFANMKKSEFIEYIKKEFNAVAKNHNSVFFRTEEDAKKIIEWIESLKLAYKMKEDLS